MATTLNIKPQSSSLSLQLRLFCNSQFISATILTVIHMGITMVLASEVYGLNLIARYNLNLLKKIPYTSLYGVNAFMCFSLKISKRKALFSSLQQELKSRL
jgi:hypothetical protein